MDTCWGCYHEVSLNVFWHTDWKETPGQIQDTLEGLHPLAGLGALGNPPRVARVCVKDVWAALRALLVTLVRETKTFLI